MIQEFMFKNVVQIGLPFLTIILAYLQKPLV